MSLSALMPHLAIVLAVATIAMVAAGRAGWPAGSLIAATLAAGALGFVGWWINCPPRDRLAAPRRNARLQALIFGWGGATLLVAYPLAGLKWQHGWQYGAGLALLGALTFAFALWLGRQGEQHGAPWRPGLMWAITLVEVIACAGALLWMVAIGKLADTKGSFVAHHVLWAGGLALLAVTTFAVLGEIRAARSEDSANAPSARS